jgi:hypothetical protein
MPSEKVPDWAKKRLAELEAAAPVKRKKAEAFVKVPLWWAEAATKAVGAPDAMVCIYLLHTSWKVKSLTFPLLNGRLKRMGVSREVKRRVLRDLEAAGLITVERRSRKTPIVTLVLL